MRIADKRKSLAVSLLLNAGVMLLFRFCMVPVFETNDDMAIMGIVNGTRGKLDIHAIQHFLLGLLYKSLYSITCSVSWYSVCQNVLAFPSKANFASLPPCWLSTLYSCTDRFYVPV